MDERVSMSIYKNGSIQEACVHAVGRILEMKKGEVLILQVGKDQVSLRRDK